jgi:hypothetical protein
LDRPIPELCRSYDAPNPTLPTIVLCHRNTPMIPARQQIEARRLKPEGRGPHF